MRTGRPPSKVDDVLSRVLQRVDPEQQLHAHSIWNFWDEAMGKTIARRARPARFRNGILFVTAANHSWLQELQFMKDDIRERLNTRLGSEIVRDIFFHTGTVVEEPEEPAPAPARPPAGNPLVEVPPIADAEIAAAFARILQARARRLTAVQEPSARRRRR